jgi:hypothetical protein
MSLPSAHAWYPMDLHDFLANKAARYYVDAEHQRLLVERTILVFARDLPLFEEGEVEHKISRVLHRLAVVELRGTTRPRPSKDKQPASVGV